MPVKPSILSDVAISELSVIKALGADGKRWAPRNSEARVIGVKGAPCEDAKPTFLERFANRLTKGWLVKDDVPDFVDGDGDGTEDVEQIVSVLMAAYYDLSNAMQISGEAARSAAVVASVQTFLANLDDIRSGGEGNVAKAGRAHSAATIARIKDVRAKLKSHLNDVDGMLADIAPEEKATELDDDPGEDLAEGETVEALDYDPEVEEKAGAVTPGASAYADPGVRPDKKKRYPLDTAAHVRAAASFFARESNRSKYTPEQAKKIDAKIAAAKKKYGIGEKAAPETPAAPIAATGFDADTFKAQLLEAIDARISESVAKSAPAPVDLAPITARIDEVNVGISQRLDAQRAADDTRFEEVAALAKASTEKAAALEATLTAVVGEAAKPTAPGGIATQKSDGSTAAHPATAEPAQKATPTPPPGLSPLAAAIHAQRMAEQVTV